MTACLELMAGSALVATLVFRTPAGAPCTPTTVDATMRLPDGSTVPLAAVNVGAATWEVPTPVLTASGRYWLQGQGTGGGCDVVAEATWTVVAPRIPLAP